MTVFKGFLLFAKRNFLIFIVYILIFLSICFLSQISGMNAVTDTFEVSYLAVGIVNLDGSQLSFDLIAYLDETLEILPLANDKALLQERLLYQDVDMIIVIPNTFETDRTVQIVKASGTENGYYVTQMIDRYMSGVSNLMASGFTQQESSVLVLNSLQEHPDVRMISSGNKRTDFPAYTFMYTFMPYIMISVICFTLGSITMDFYKPDVLRRLRCSALSSFRRNMEFFLGYLTIGLLIWGIINAMPLILYGRELITDSHYPWYLANSLILVLMTLCLTFLLGLLIRKSEILTPVVNILSLGMSFVCGVFVSLDLLSDDLVRISRFLPVYWYETVNWILMTTKHLSSADILAIFKGFGFQFLFAAVFLGISLLISRIRIQEN